MWNLEIFRIEFTEAGSKAVVAEEHTELFNAISEFYLSSMILPKDKMELKELDIIRFQLSQEDRMKYPIDEMGDPAELFETIVECMPSQG